MSAHRRLAVISTAIFAASVGVASAEPQTGEAINQQMTKLQAFTLVRSTLMSIHDANQSGNYTVLKDLGSPTFQRRSANDLAKLFAPLRHRNLDLFAAASTPPKLSGPIEQDRPDRLHVKGVFPTQPQQLVFDFVFERADGEWKHSKLSLGLKPLSAP